MAYRERRLRLGQRVEAPALAAGAWSKEQLDAGRWSIHRCGLVAVTEVDPEETRQRDQPDGDGPALPRLSLTDTSPGEAQPMLLASTVPGVGAVDDTQHDGQRLIHDAASVVTSKSLSDSRPAENVVTTLPRRIRSLLRQRGADAVSRSVHRSVVRAVPINDAPLVKDVAVPREASLVGASPGRPTFTHLPTDNQSWCPSCGRPQNDPMTGLMDRWTWAQYAAMLLEKFGSGRDPITLLLADLDRFKSINDSAGHMAGDAVLATVADAIRAETRSGDVWGRYGSYAGDEFIGLLPGASLPAAVSVAERLQRRVGAMSISVATPTVATERIGNLSISIGLATHTPGCSLDDTVGRADTALLAAKHNGRGCVCLVDAHSRIIVARKRDHSGRHARSRPKQAC